MERRLFIRLSVFSATALSIPVLTGCNDRHVSPLIAQPPLLSHLVDANTIREIGQAYLQQVPAENNKNKLTELLLEGHTLEQSPDAKTVHMMFDKKIQHDFETGEIITVKGWVLSVTEARQCALFVLMHN